MLLVKILLKLVRTEHIIVRRITVSVNITERRGEYGDEEEIGDENEE